MTRITGKNSDKQFEEFEATLLYCPKCKEAVPVRKRLLLCLLDGEKYDYICTRCAAQVGTKHETVKEDDKIVLVK